MVSDARPRLSVTGWPIGRLEAKRTEVLRFTTFCRRTITAVRHCWSGRNSRVCTYYVCSSLFLRLLGGIYLIAFVSLWLQIDGLIGQRGIVPAQQYLDQVERYFEDRDPSVWPGWNVPTLAWISASDRFLHCLCAGGTVLSVLLIIGILPIPTLILLWLSYLSLFHVGQVFMSFQWDILLLETGFLAIFIAPHVRFRSLGFADSHPPRLALWLIWWLLFRLMFESGVVKLTWNDAQVGPDGSQPINVWESLTAMNFHYWTQPLPLWTSWYVHQLPLWFQKISVSVVYLIELGLPFFIFGPRWMRYMACGGIVLLMLLIAGTGNYNFFNLLTLVLALTLLDDGIWPQWIQDRISGSDAPQLKTPIRWRIFLLLPFACLALLLGTLQIQTALFPTKVPKPSLESKLQLNQFFLVNDYGLFRKMTETRPEIVIEGSMDGRMWRPYAFRWKPGDLACPPRFNTPHQPRLDWQMWFEALRLEQVHAITGGIDPRHMSPWFQSLLSRLLHQESEVLKLMREKPFPDSRPNFIRITLYQYRFTTSEEKRKTGNWWHRERVWQGPGWSQAK